MAMVNQNNCICCFLNLMILFMGCDLKKDNIKNKPLLVNDSRYSVLDSCKTGKFLFETYMYKNDNDSIPTFYKVKMKNGIEYYDYPPYLYNGNRINEFKSFPVDLGYYESVNLSLNSNNGILLISDDFYELEKMLNSEDDLKSADFQKIIQLIYSSKKRLFSKDLTDELCDKFPLLNEKLMFDNVYLFQTSFKSFDYIELLNIYFPYELDNLTMKNSYRIKYLHLYVGEMVDNDRRPKKL